MKRKAIASILCLLLALNSATIAFANELPSDTASTDVEVSAVTSEDVADEDTASKDAETDEGTVSENAETDKNTTSEDANADSVVPNEAVNENPDTTPIDGETEKGASNPFARAARAEVESNDTRATADTIYAGDTMTGYMQKSGDIDCFKYVAASNGKITVTQTGIPSDKIYNLWLQNTSGAELTRGSNNGSTTATSNSYTYNVTSGTTYYIVTNAASGYSASQKYTISLTLTATTQSKTLSVSRQSQGNTNWCWAAVTSMIASYEGYSKTQSQIVTYIHGSAGNYTGNQSNIVSALKWINSSRFTSATYQNLTSSSYDSLVVSQIMASKPVQVACTPTNGASLGHSYLIYSVQNTNTVSMIDPWGSNGNLTLGKDALTTSFYSSVLGTNVKGVSCVKY